MFRTIARIATAAVLAGTAALALAGTAAAAAPTTPPSHFTRCTYGPTSQAIAANIAHDSVETQMTTWINQYRAQNGLPALRVTYGMQKVAVWLSVDGAFRGTSNHTDTLGRAPRARAMECSGYSANAFLGEIIYWGEGGGPQGNTAGSAASALAWWKQSPGHNALLLSRDATTFGVGRAYMGVNAERQHWTVNFGTS